MIPDVGQDNNKVSQQSVMLAGNGEYGDYHEWRLLVSDALRDAGYEDDADEFWACSCDNAVFWTDTRIPIGDDVGAVRAYVCKEHGAKIIRNTCHLRICPDCARRAANRLIARYKPKIDECIHSHNPAFRFRKIVLTSPYDLASPGAKKEYKRLKKLIPQVFGILLGSDWRKNQGFIVADEWGEDGHKLHFHILFYGQWVSNRAKDGYPLATAWQAITNGDCEVAYIAGVNAERVEAEIVETLKYCVKFWKSDPETGDTKRLAPELMVLLHEMLKGQRRVRSYGIFYRVPPAPDRPPVCPVCHAELIRMSVLEYNIWLETGWLPDEQTLNLRIGNKSPPEAMSDSGESSTLAAGKEYSPVQPPLSPDFGGSNHAMSYLS